jgi:hypothetical protein
VLVLFTFNQQVRETLEKAHENERLEELYEVFAEGRSVEVDFAGLVTRQNGDLWLVSGVPVATSAQTVLPAQSIAIGDAVHIVGVTQKDGAVLAKKIELLPAGMPLPEYEHDEASEHEGSDGSKQGSDDNSGKGSESEEESPKNEATQTPDSESGSDSSSEYEMEEESFSGVIESVNGNILVINGQIANISSAEIKGTVRAGLSVKVEGYYDANGLFIVTKIEFKSSSSIDGGSGSSDDDGSDDDGGSGSSDDNGSNDNGDDENDNDNDGGDADNENSGESSDD